MSSLVLLSLALAPTVAIIWYFYLKDEFDREPTHLLVKCFLLGIVSIIPALAFGSLGSSFGIAPSENVFTTAIMPLSL